MWSFVSDFFHLTLIFSRFIHVVTYISTSSNYIYIIYIYIYIYIYICNLKKFSPILWVVFTFLMISFEAESLFILMKSNLPFSLLPVLLLSYLRNHYENQCHEDVPPPYFLLSILWL